MKVPIWTMNFQSTNKLKIIFTHNSVSQNNRQLKQFSVSSEDLFFELVSRVFGDFVAVTTSVNCIKLIDHAANIRWTIVKLRWTPGSLNASNNSIISATYKTRREN